MCRNINRPKGGKEDSLEQLVKECVCRMKGNERFSHTAEVREETRGMKTDKLNSRGMKSESF